MTYKDKLEKLKKVADAMYYTAQHLTTDASKLHKAMDEYHKFIINEYHKEEPEYLEEETKYCAFSTSRYTDKERKVLCDGCEEECRFNKEDSVNNGLDLGCGVIWIDKEPVSEKLREAVNNYCVNVRKGYPRVMDETDRYIYNAFKAGANWQKEKLLVMAVDGEVTYGKSLAIPSLGYRLDKERLDFGDKVKVIVIKEG